ncbi:hypothetical protein ACFE04_020670 [Oxalis oulophora]
MPKTHSPSTSSNSSIEAEMARKECVTVALCIAKRIPLPKPIESVARAWKERYFQIKWTTISWRHIFNRRCLDPTLEISKNPLKLSVMDMVIMDALPATIDDYPRLDLFALQLNLPPMLSENGRRGSALTLNPPWRLAFQLSMIL